MKRTVKIHGVNHLCIDSATIARGGSLDISLNPTPWNGAGPYIVSWVDSKAPKPITTDLPLTEPQNKCESEKSISKAKYRNLQVTFALAIECVVDINSDFKKKNKAINISSIAKHLSEKYATKTTNIDSKNAINERITGQSDETIRKRIKNALEIKKENY
ncbi:hypothetical protein NMYAN_210014 [Nitrosomonas nitrosa]|uniref:Uncharacterized protein n=1 Tax=Nitrosomonas nitrosa TaxID=52442 RepID=A0A8H8Z1R5_9PROT|nr:hypothetical protein [Nitrosomonas nitrosa]CAE6506018.1 hypothetical protein NMYAN_210014 [Nitrosomonas nitrosa]